MAKLGGFLQVTDIRGKLGGNVFSKSRSAHTLRAKVKPSNPRSAAQSTVRANITNGSRAAKALSSGDVVAWKAYAASITLHNDVSGAAYSPSWITALTGLYQRFTLATPGGSFPTLPPAAPYGGDTITLSVAGSAGTVTLTGSAQQTAGSTTFVYLEKLKSANRTPSNKPGKLHSVAPVPVSPFHIAIAALAAGYYDVKYCFVDTATGQAGPIVDLGVVHVS